MIKPKKKKKNKREDRYVGGYSHTHLSPLLIQKPTLKPLLLLFLSLSALSLYKPEGSQHLPQLARGIGYDPSVPKQRKREKKLSSNSLNTPESENSRATVEYGEEEGEGEGEGEAEGEGDEYGRAAASSASASTADDSESEAAHVAAELGGPELQQQHVEGGRGDVQVRPVHLQGQGGGD